MRYLLRNIKLFIIRYFKQNVLIGKGCIIDLGSRINAFRGKIELHDNVTLRSSARGYHAGMPFPTTLLVDVEHASIVIGKNSRINGTYIHAQAGINIGKNCVFAAGVNIIDSNGHEVRSLNRTMGRDKPAQISIGDNVWIGINAIILKDTSIGKNSIVAAGSVVKGQYPSNAIIAGNPAVVTSYIEF